MKIKIFYITMLLLAFSLVRGYSQTKAQPDASACTFDCSPTPWVLNLHLAPMATWLKSDQYSSEETGQLGLSGGLDLAYYLKNTGKLKIALSLGANYSYYSTKRNISFNDSVWTKDYSGDPVHIYEAGMTEETQKAAFINIPLKLRFDYQLSPRWDLYFNAGYFYALSMSKTYSSTGAITRKGYYPSTNALVYDIDVAGSQLFYPTNKSVAGSGDLMVKNNSGLELNLGLKYKINPRISFFVGAKMLNSFGSISDYPSTSEFTHASNMHTLNTLMSRGDKITSRALGVEFGLAFNLGKCKKDHGTPPSVVKLDSVKPVQKDSAKAVVVQEVKDTVKSVPVVVKGQEKIEDKKEDKKETPMIAGKEDIQKVPEPIVLEFVDNKNRVINAPLKSIPSRTYTLAEVNELLKKGAKIQKKRNILQRIEFEYNSNTLTAESERCLDQLIDFMKVQDDCGIIIYGNTDNKGKPEYNMALSQKRAQVVVDYMTARGITKSRLKAIGRGQDYPINTNDTPEGRQNNRRAEFEIIWK